jgi:hypothetical protein
MMGDMTNRREFTRRAIVASVAASCGLGLNGSGTALAQDSISDFDILNFALNLEFLEAEFYTVATTGRRLADLGIAVSGRRRGGETIGGARVALDDRTRVVAEQIALDEQAHVRLLQSVLRSSAVSKPAINLEALGVGFRNQAEFLTVASIFEDVGVSAYAGAAALIHDREVLGAAARIALTEGQHAGVLRHLASQANLSVPPLDGKDVPQLGQPNGRLFFVDGNGLSPARSAAEVLRIVYGGNDRQGGFFPEGVNGDIARA